ncbi:hypothetical protein P8452_11682 [Trifolium repens]|nr:hypothetical protein P8452_11682 [Trifolium repens]
METFPEGGMPASLRSLYLRNCEKLLRNPSLTLFDMLTELSIVGPCDGVESFPNKGFALLLPSLTSLYLLGMSSLQTLECTGLLHLTSLQRLTFVDCPQLENMEGERLPASLIKLDIRGCPLLGERCRMKHPQIWPKISHIKGVESHNKYFISHFQIDNNQRPRFPGKIEASNNVMQELDRPLQIVCATSQQIPIPSPNDSAQLCSWNQFLLFMVAALIDVLRT